MCQLQSCWTSVLLFLLTPYGFIDYLQIWQFFCLPLNVEYAGNWIECDRIFVWLITLQGFIDHYCAVTGITSTFPWQASSHHHHTSHHHSGSHHQHPVVLSFSVIIFISIIVVNINANHIFIKLSKVVILRSTKKNYVVKTS